MDDLRRNVKPEFADRRARGAAGIGWQIPTTPDERMHPSCLPSVAPAGLWSRVGYRYPPLKRWAIVGRPCGAAAPAVIAREADEGTACRPPLRGGWARRERTEAASQVRRTTENSPAIYRWETGAKDKTSPARDERGPVGTRLCAPTVFRPHPDRLCRFLLESDAVWVYLSGRELRR